MRGALMGAVAVGAALGTGWLAGPSQGAALGFFSVWALLVARVATRPRRRPAGGARRPGGGPADRSADRDASLAGTAHG